MIWSDDPVRDAERYYTSLPETLDWCPFCQEPVQDTDEYIRGRDGSYAHVECVEKEREMVENFE